MKQVCRIVAQEAELKINCKVLFLKCEDVFEFAEIKITEYSVYPV